MNSESNSNVGTNLVGNLEYWTKPDSFPNYKRVTLLFEWVEHNRDLINLNADNFIEENKLNELLLKNIHSRLNFAINSFYAFNSETNENETFNFYYEKNNILENLKKNFSRAISNLESFNQWIINYNNLALKDTDSEIDAHLKSFQTIAEKREFCNTISNTLNNSQISDFYNFALEKKRKLNIYRNKLFTQIKKLAALEKIKPYDFLFKNIELFPEGNFNSMEQLNEEMQNIENALKLFDVSTVLTLPGEYSLLVSRLKLLKTISKKYNVYLLDFWNNYKIINEVIIFDNNLTTFISKLGERISIINNKINEFNESKISILLQKEIIQLTDYKNEAVIQKQEAITALTWYELNQKYIDQYFTDFKFDIFTDFESKIENDISFIENILINVEDVSWKIYISQHILSSNNLINTLREAKTNLLQIKNLTKTLLPEFLESEDQFVENVVQNYNYEDGDFILKKNKLFNYIKSLNKIIHRIEDVEYIDIEPYKEQLRKLKINRKKLSGLIKQRKNIKNWILSYDQEISSNNIELTIIHNFNLNFWIAKKRLLTQIKSSIKVDNKFIHLIAIKRIKLNDILFLIKKRINSIKRFEQFNQLLSNSVYATTNTYLSNSVMLSRINYFLNEIKRELLFFENDNWEYKNKSNVLERARRLITKFSNKNKELNRLGTELLPEPLLSQKANIAPRKLRKRSTKMWKNGEAVFHSASSLSFANQPKNINIQTIGMVFPLLIFGLGFAYLIKKIYKLVKNKK